MLKKADFFRFPCPFLLRKGFQFIKQILGYFVRLRFNMPNSFSRLWVSQIPFRLLRNPFVPTLLQDHFALLTPACSQLRQERSRHADEVLLLHQHDNKLPRFRIAGTFLARLRTPCAELHVAFLRWRRSCTRQRGFIDKVPYTSTPPWEAYIINTSFPSLKIKNK